MFFMHYVHIFVVIQLFLLWKWKKRKRRKKSTCSACYFFFQQSAWINGCNMDMWAIFSFFYFSIFFCLVVARLAQCMNSCYCVLKYDREMKWERLSFAHKEALVHRYSECYQERERKNVVCMKNFKLNKSD